MTKGELIVGHFPNGSVQTSLDHLPISSTHLFHLIELMLTCDNFSFNGDHNLQAQGTAMGIRVAPSYANLLMANLENNLMAMNSTKPKVSVESAQKDRTLSKDRASLEITCWPAVTKQIQSTTKSRGQLLYRVQALQPCTQ